MTEIKIAEHRYVNLIDHERESIKTFEGIVKHFIREWQQQYVYDVRLNSSNTWRLMEHYVNTKLDAAEIIFKGKTGSIWINSSGIVMYWGFQDSVSLASLSNLLENYYAYPNVVEAMQRVADYHNELVEKRILGEQ